jgi:hypothetical protein
VRRKDTRVYHDEVLADHYLALELAIKKPVICPFCGKVATARIFNSHLNRYEFKHVRRGLETKWCKPNE